jgi:GNAT superfamily N-acetyltransferase
MALDGSDRISPAALRPAGTSDSLRLAELSKQLGYPQSAGETGERLAALSANPDHAVFVATAGNDEPVGWIHVYLRSLLQAAPHAEVGGLVVDESRRGRGIGSLLLDKAEQWARDRGVGRVMLHTNVVRKQAHEFYAGNGYTAEKQSLRFSKRLYERKKS